MAKFRVRILFQGSNRTCLRKFHNILRSTAPVLSFFLGCGSSESPILSCGSGDGIPVETALQLGWHCSGDGILVGTAFQWGRHCSGVGEVVVMTSHSASTELTQA